MNHRSICSRHFFEGKCQKTLSTYPMQEIQRNFFLIKIRDEEFKV